MRQRHDRIGKIIQNLESRWADDKDKSPSICLSVGLHPRLSVQFGGSASRCSQYVDLEEGGAQIDRIVSVNDEQYCSKLVSDELGVFGK